MGFGPRWFSWWILPVIATIVWFGTILGMLVVWLAEGSPHYSEMDPDENIAYISDVGAHLLKPLFIAGSSVTAVSFCLSLVGERWLRHSERIVPNRSILEKIFAVFAIIGAVVGSAGLILLSIFDTLRHSRLHRIFLAVFAAGILASALGTVLEYWMLGRHNHRNRAVRHSMWFKAIFFVVEFALAIAFGVTMNEGINNPAAVLEWVLAAVFCGYLVSFIIDLWYATKTEAGDLREGEKEDFHVDNARARREQPRRQFF